MARGMSFGIGAGAVSVLAALVAVSPTVQGDVAVKAEKKAEGPAQPAKREDRRVRIVMGGGSISAFASRTSTRTTSSASSCPRRRALS